MNKFEDIKSSKDGLDVWPDIQRCAEEGGQTISDDDKVRMKWYGLFFRKHTPGQLMLRIRVPNGRLSSGQLRLLARLASQHSSAEFHLTTRQQVQLRGFGIEHAPSIISQLRAAGLDTRQTGMDNIRNVLSCPLAGLSAHELFDASAAVDDLTRQFVGNKAFSNLPRKFNVAISACVENCLPLESQDIALVPAQTQAAGGAVLGFNVLLGGKMGSGGFTQAQPLGVFVTSDEAVDLCCQMIGIFRDHGSRDARSRARLAFLVQDWGMDRLRAELEVRLGRELAPAGWDLRRARESDHLGITPQHQPGTYAVGLAVPVGRLGSQQAVQLARLAEAYGSGEVRLTPGQNLILTNVGGRRLAQLLAEPLLAELPADPSPALRGTVACTGAHLCDLALTDTKRHAIDVARRLDGAGLRKPIAINWSGCPAGCGNHALADIGLQGGRARIDGEVQQVYQVSVGGRSGRAAQAGREVLAAVPAAEVGGIVERLVRAREAGQDLLTTALEIAAARDHSGQAAA